MAKKKYTVDYFIKKFKAIPANRWTTGTFKDTKGRRCVYGHCGALHKDTLQSQALDEFGLALGRNFVMINDGRLPSYPQKSPKARVLSALKDIKKETEALES